MGSKNSQGQILIEACLFMFFILLVFCIGFSKFQEHKGQPRSGYQGFKSYENIKQRNQRFQFSKDVSR